MSAESLAARSPAVLPTAGRGGRVVRSGGRAAGRLAVICVLAIAALATVAMAVVLGWIVFSTGIDEPAAWLTAPFTALTGFASWQLFSSARASGFRGRPWALLSRGFRDSVRLWGSGSAISRVAMTTTATASVAGAAAAPAVLGPAARWDLFVVDTATAAVYRVDLDTLESTRLAGGSGEGRAVALGSTQKRLTLPDGRRISAGSLLVVVEGPNGAQRFLAVRPRATQPIVGSLIEPPLPGAHFAAGAGAAFGLQPDGSLWRIDPASGAAETITRLTIEPGPMSFEPSTGDLLVISGNRAFRVDAETGEVRGSTVAGPEGFSACGVARGRGDSLFLTQDGSNTILAVRTGSREARQLRLSGDVPLSPCQVAAVKR